MQPSQFLQPFSCLYQFLQSLYIRRTQFFCFLRDPMVDNLVNALTDRFFLLCLAFCADLCIKDLRCRSLLLRIRKMIDDPCPGLILLFPAAHTAFLPPLCTARP